MYSYAYSTFLLNSPSHFRVPVPCYPLFLLSCNFMSLLCFNFKVPLGAHCRSSFSSHRLSESPRVMATNTTEVLNLQHPLWCPTPKLLITHTTPSNEVFKFKTESLILTPTHTHTHTYTLRGSQIWESTILIPAPIFPMSGNSTIIHSLLERKLLKCLLIPLAFTSSSQSIGKFYELHM